MEPSIRISFGIIVLNGEPYTPYCLRSLYPHAHQIIISEGACPGAESISTSDGHSTDLTLNVIRHFMAHEDPLKKIILVTAEEEGHPNGFWPGEKDEMSRAWTKRATGNYIWQVDVDEFYKDEDIVLIKKTLAGNPGISAVSFRQLQFWGGFSWLVDSYLLRRGAHNFHRLFKWEENFSYSAHRPPTVINGSGKNLREVNWLNASETMKMGIFLYHYSFVFPKQVREKAQYYKNADWSKRNRAEWWAEEVYMKLRHPFRVFSVYWDLSWLKPFKGDHPPAIRLMMDDLKAGRMKEETRPTADLELLVGNPFYKLAIRLLILWEPLDAKIRPYLKSFKRKLKRLLS